MREHYKADQLQEQVQIVRKTETPDGVGGFVTGEAILPSPSTYHLCMQRPLRGEERLVAGGIGATNELLFVMYAAIEVRPTDALLYNGERYNVRRINPPGLSQFREVEAETGVASDG